MFHHCSPYILLFFANKNKNFSDLSLLAVDNPAIRVLHVSKTTPKCSCFVFRFESRSQQIVEVVHEI
ncbi:Protein CBG27907 [Caenorhabditis briggsae]|uniref:Protein CBG27907 n=1 Tax=Caenorhabditis briggsae TaxID=6238 RepID=B6IEK2_CAEBR|nr:Protein CBG27907 [Caenorhabditis briggsae]CAR98332.1 Protein CBG27907 [Caenorhabditis briggsae]